MIRWGATLLFLAGCIATLTAAGVDESARASSAAEILERAQSARRDGLPQVVIHDLRSKLATLDNPSERIPIAVELARCLILSGRTNEALGALSDSALQGSPEVRYWRSVALAEAGSTAAALEGFRSVSAVSGSSLTAPARWHEARMLEKTGNVDAARYVLESLASDPVTVDAAIPLEIARLLVASEKYAEASNILDSIENPSDTDQRMITYLRARIALDLGNADIALNAFQSLVHDRDALVRTGAVVGAADALISLNRLPDAEASLEQFISQHPNNPEISLAFAKLDEVYQAIPESGSTDLRRWARNTANPDLAAYATFYLGAYELRAGRIPQALSAFSRFAEEQSKNPLRARAIIEAVQILLDENRVKDAFDILSISAELRANDPAWPQLQFLRAMLNLASGRELVARSLFINVSEMPGPLAQIAADNAALSQALAGDKWSEKRQAIAVTNEQPISDEAALRSAMVIARNLRDDAGLRKLSNSAESAPVRAKASLAIAEFAVTAGRIDEARSYFQKAVNQPGVTSDQTAAIEVFLSDDATPGADEAVISKARSYLSQFGNTSRAPEVRMKLAEVLARTGDHRAAWLEFERAGRDTPDNQTAAAALFFAATSAGKTMNLSAIERSIELYEEVAQIGGPLAPLARFDQAMVYNQMGRTNEARVLLERLSEEAETPEVRQAARMKLADTLFSSSEAEPDQLRRAMQIWTSVAESSVSPSDRNEALTKMAAAHELLGETDAALSGYYRVLESGNNEDHEFFWFYKAGFDAARLLEQAGQWQEAMNVYQKLADANGPRADEAATRVKRLKLENFIWD